MKYKVGDEVKIREDLKTNNFYGGYNFNTNMDKYCGQILTIKNVSSDGCYYHVEEDRDFVFTDEMIERKVNMIKVIDLLKDIAEGKEVPKEISYIDRKYELIKGGFFDYYGDKDKKDEMFLNNVLTTKDFLNSYVEIIEDTPILDKVEKKWLSNFIKSTKIKNCKIKKWLGASCENEYLQITYDVYDNYYKDLKGHSLFLPLFKRGTMYKGMELNKEYTLEELGL